jgi:hypothetical protein
LNDLLTFQLFVDGQPWCDFTLESNSFDRTLTESLIAVRNARTLAKALSVNPLLPAEMPPQLREEINTTHRLLTDGSVELPAKGLKFTVDYVSDGTLGLASALEQHREETPPPFITQWRIDFFGEDRGVAKVETVVSRIVLVTPPWFVRERLRQTSAGGTVTVIWGGAEDATATIRYLGPPDPNDTPCDFAVRPVLVDPQTRGTSP